MTETPTPATPRRSLWGYLNDRAGRAEYWFSIGLIFALGIGLSFIPALSGAGTGLTVVLMFAQIRRVHDFGRSGWWAALATFAPMIAMFPLMAVASVDVAFIFGLLVEFALIIAIGAIPGDPGDNRFGPPAPFTWKRTLTGR
ncbi:MAG: DUF805 domain-containing protein [Phenylobacterium sp.]